MSPSQLLFCAGLLLCAAAAHPQAGEPAATLVDYQRVGGISGNLSSTGSDTLANLMTLWTEHFKREYPNVHVQVQAPGSSTAPPALTQGTVNFGPMSRRMKDRELQAFQSRFGYRPTAVRVALDALVIYVHRDNPLSAISLPELDAVFSVTRRCGEPRAIERWGELGLDGSWTDRPIQLYGRNSVSGTYGYFKQVALCSGDFRNEVNEQPGSASVVQAVSSSLNGIGYSGIGYVTSDVKSLALARADQAAAVRASAATVLDGSYPLTRYLYVYVNKPPGRALPPVEREFLRMVLSRQGQAIVAKDGYVPLPAATANRELQRVLL
jgi:phosphate transport system substrate-binding protein